MTTKGVSWRCWATCSTAFLSRERSILQTMDANATVKIIEITLTILTPALGLFLLWGARKVIQFAERKTGIDLPVKQEKQIDAWILQAIAFAEEKARKASKSKLSKVTGPEKLELAADYVIDLIQKAGWDTWARDKLKNRIEALLNIERGGAPAVTLNPVQ